MSAWDCPTCGRRFARAGQGHECAPAMTVEEYFSTGPVHERPVFDALMARLADIGTIVVEPVSVGIFLKRAGTFAQLRPMTRWVALGFSLPRIEHHRLITRKPISHGGRWYLVANIAHPDDIDDDIVGWVTEAYGNTAS